MQLGRFYFSSKRCKLLRRRKSFPSVWLALKRVTLIVMSFSFSAIVRLPAFFFTFLSLSNRLFQTFQSLLSFPFSSSFFNDHGRLSRSSAQVQPSRSFSLKFLPTEDANKPLSQMTVSVEHKAI